MRAAAAAAATAAIACAAPLAAQTREEPSLEAPAEDGAEGPAAAASSPGEAPAPPPSAVGVSVTLRGLDKLSGATRQFEIAVGSVGRFDRMRIAVETCNARFDTDAPESSVFLVITDTKPDPPQEFFSGWMFASSPALSAMDHPRYDFWVVSCNTS